EVDRAYRGSYRRWLKKGPTNVPIPHAEKITSFRRRIERAFAAIVRENAGTDKNILVVTHGGVIAAYLAHVLDADFNRVLLGLHLPNTCVTLVSFKKEKRSLIHVADTLHLSDDRPPVD
ncbi:MAG: histidine phosphatase family protein, partial [Candidatus Omnitrophota bacterium]